MQETKEIQFQSLGGEDPLGAWQPTLVFLPGEFHGQRSLAGYSLKGHKELDTSEQPGVCKYRHDVWYTLYLS